MLDKEAQTGSELCGLTNFVTLSWPLNLSELQFLLQKILHTEVLEE